MKIKCCNCGSVEIMNVEYGTPDDEMIKRIEKGEILHGGCAVSGLMQKYYCMDCDTRFDDECSDLFVDHIRRIEFKDEQRLVEIIFSKESLHIKFDDTEKDIEYTDDIKKALKKTQVEYLQSFMPRTYSIRFECFGYIQDIVEKSGNHDEPVNASLFINWIDEILKK